MKMVTKCLIVLCALFSTISFAQGVKRENVTLEQCATVRAGEGFVSPTVVAQCSVFFEGFAEMAVEGIGSSPLIGCRLISDGTARLKKDPNTVLERWTVIAVYTDSQVVARKLKAQQLFFPITEGDSCKTWREKAANALVANPVPPKLEPVFK